MLEFSAVLLPVPFLFHHSSNFPADFIFVHPRGNCATLLPSLQNSPGIPILCDLCVRLVLPLQWTLSLQVGENLPIIVTVFLWDRI